MYAINLNQHHEHAQVFLERGCDHLGGSQATQAIFAQKNAVTCPAGHAVRIPRRAETEKLA